MLSFNRVQVVLAVAAAVLLAAGGVAAASNHPAKHDWVQLQSADYRGTTWRLMTREQGAQLCLKLEPVSQPAGSYLGAGGCGFDNKHHDGGYFASGPGPAGAISSFGPLPTMATQIRIASDQVIMSYPLPKGSGLPAGRYWIFVPPTGWPDATSGPATHPQPLDDNGNPVPFGDF